MFKLGRNRPTQHARLRLAHYLNQVTLPAPPLAVDYSRDVAALADVLGNDTLGDCTAAGAAHILDSLRWRAGDDLPPASEGDTIAFYAKSTGYNPADPSSDQGGDEISVLNCWRDHGFFADGSGRISGYASVDATHPQEVRQAIWLFGNLYLGLELPQTWVEPFPAANGFTWWEAGRSNPANGHCVVALGYDRAGVLISTWGLIGRLSWHALAAYATPGAGGAAYTVFSPDELQHATQRAPNGFAAEQLAADLAAI